MDNTSLESSLKISNIQSLQHEVKQEKEPSEESTIKIRTISEINQSQIPIVAANKSVLISKQHPSQQQQQQQPAQFLSKQIVVRKVPNENKSSTIQRITTNGSPKLIKNSALPIPESPMKPAINLSIPPALDTYIKELEEQNKEMKKLLLECRREVVSIQMRTHKLTNLINTTVAKCNAAKRPVIKQPVHHIISQPIPISPQQQQFHTTSMLQKKTLKIVPKKNHNITSKGNIVCRVPVFPITRIQILKQLEVDLSKKEFSEYVFQKLYNVNNKPDIDKPSVLLNNTLNSILDQKLMGLFQYDESGDNNKGGECEYFKSLQRIRVLYGKLVNALSNTIFAKSVDMVALEKFVKNKISSHRNEHLVKMDKIKAAKMAEIKSESQDAPIKTEKVDNDDKCVNIDESNLQWINEDEPMNTEED